jgi:serpin B
LSLLLNGLQAQGYQEVADALGYGELPLEEVNAFQRTVWEQVHAEGDAYEVRQALALYTVTPYRWTAAVKQQAQGRYPAAFYELESASLPQQIGQVQSWLQEQTKNRVALSPELWGQIAAYPTLAGVVSALFLKAEWEQPLGIAPSIEFRTADGRKRLVDAMARRYERLSYLKERDFEAVALPYRGGQLRFYLFLPREGVSLRQWVRQLDAARWRAWRKQFKEREVELHMPKFEVASEHDLRDTLQQIGVQQIFRDGGLRGVIEGAEKAGYIGLWAQQATVRVDERGTEAAAGSAITAFVLDYGTVQMRVDRPFLFAIVHEPTELILFIGVVHAPPATARR